MQHPFGKILGASDIGYVREDHPQDGESRREHLKRVLQLGVGALAAGVPASALAGDVTTDAIGEEGGKQADSDVFPQRGNRLRGTKAGPGHPEHGGRFQDPMPILNEAAKLLGQGDWAGAAKRHDRLRSTMWAHRGKLLEPMSQQHATLKGLVAKDLAEAEKQAKAGDLVPALLTLRKAQRLNALYGFKEPTTVAIDKLSKHELYPVALAKVEAIEKKQQDKPATRARLEEGGRPHITTKAVGEEGGKPPFPFQQPTTLAIGEEGGDFDISTRLAEEEGGRRPNFPTKALYEAGGGPRQAK